MSFFIETAKPYNFSYYIIRIDSRDELKEIALNTPLIHTKVVLQLILKTESLTLVFDNHGEKGSINIYNNLDEKPYTKVFDTKDNKYSLHDCFSFFISSHALPFIFLSENDFYMSLSRIEDDVCNMYGCFFVNGGTKEQITKIMANPAILIGEYEKITEDNILTDEQIDTAKAQLNEYVSENEEITKLNESKPETVEHQILEIEPEQKTNKKNKNIKMNKKTNIMEVKTFEQLSDTQKVKMNAIIDNLKEEKNIETENIEVKNIENKKNIVKYGRFMGHKIKFEEKKLDYVVSVRNYEQMTSILILLIMNMKMNGYDTIEVRSELDIFIMKYDNDIVVFMHDQVCKEDIKEVKMMSNLRMDIQKEMKNLH